MIVEVQDSKGKTCGRVVAQVATIAGDQVSFHDLCVIVNFRESYINCNGNISFIKWFLLILCRMTSYAGGQYFVSQSMSLLEKYNFT